jgi:hypothetical protein
MHINNHTIDCIRGSSPGRVALLIHNRLKIVEKPLRNHPRVVAFDLERVRTVSQRI